MEWTILVVRAGCDEWVTDVSITRVECVSCVVGYGERVNLIQGVRALEEAVGSVWIAVGESGSLFNLDDLTRHEGIWGSTFYGRQIL